MSWPTQQLARVADFRLGKMLDEKKDRGELMPYLANVNVRWGEFDLMDFREMRFEDHERDTFGLTHGDIVMCEGGEPGRCAIWKDECPGMMIQKALHRIRPHACLDHRFLFYTFLHMGKTGQFAPLFTGATIKHLPREKLELLEIPIPALSVQKRIAEVLFAYDDLIDNNRRRMKLLADAARQLYQEWFVRLRFPSYEHTRITNGVPAGWKKTDLESTCLPRIEIQTGPFGSQLHQSDYSENGIAVVMPKDIVGSTVAVNSIARVPDEIRQRLSRHILESGDIVLARRGDIGRKAFITTREAGWLCGTGCMRLRPNSEVVAPRVLFDTVGRSDVMGVIVGRAQGAIMPNLNLNVLADVPLILPPWRLQREYVEWVSPAHRQIEVLGEQNEKLRAARDLLLPRLTSGELRL